MVLHGTKLIFGVYCYDTNLKPTSSHPMYINMIVLSVLWNL